MHNMDRVRTHILIHILTRARARARARAFTLPQPLTLTRILTLHLTRYEPMHDMELDNLGCVVSDEIHYINDVERGAVWEETLMHLPCAERPRLHPLRPPPPTPPTSTHLTPPTPSPKAH